VDFLTAGFARVAFDLSSFFFIVGRCRGLRRSVFKRRQKTILPALSFGN